MQLRALAVVKAATALNRFAWRIARGVDLLAGEAVVALVPESQRDAVGVWIYDRRETYAPGGNTCEAGLFDWEQRALSLPEFPRSGSVLLGAAGGGRELRVLRERGYDVVAFEPAPGLRAALGAGSFVAAYADLVQAVVAGTGPLAEVAGRRFDAIVLGWGSLSHVIEHRERVALLRACRALCAGPVLLSYLDSARRVGGKSERVRMGLRRALRVGLPANVRFVLHGGFAAFLSEEDVQEMASEAGYRVILQRSWPYGHALLSP